MVLGSSKFPDVYSISALAALYGVFCKSLFYSYPGYNTDIIP